MHIIPNLLFFAFCLLFKCNYCCNCRRNCNVWWCYININYNNILHSLDLSCHVPSPKQGDMFSLREQIEELEDSRGQEGWLQRLQGLEAELQEQVAELLPVLQVRKGERANLLLAIVIDRLTDLCGWLTDRSTLTSSSWIKLPLWRFAWSIFLR